MSQPLAAVYCLLAIAITGFALALLAFFSPRTAGNRSFGALMVSASIYALGYSFELRNTDVAGILSWISFEYVGIVFTPVFWLMFCWQYAGLHPPRSASVALLFAFPILTLVLVLTNEYHHLFYRSLWIDTGKPFAVLSMERGPWYWLNVLCTWLAYTMGAFVLLRFAFRSRRVLRYQAILMCLAAMVPAVGSVLYLFGLSPYGLETAAFLFSISGILISIAIFRYSFFNVAPLAREKVIESMQDAVIVVERTGRIVDANRAAGFVFGIGPDSFGLEAKEMFGTWPDLTKAIHEGVGKSEFCVDAHAPCYYRASVIPISDRGGRRLGCAVIAADVTESNRLFARLEDLANTDALTGLYNRRRFIEEAELRFAAAKTARVPFAVGITDLDNFKGVNDRFGHVAGDEVLRSIAKAFVAGLSEADRVCRYGGEEFAFLLADVSEAAVQVKFEALRHAIAGQGAETARGRIGVTASFGFHVEVPDEVDELDDFLRLADEALYRAKAEGRNRVRSL